MGGTLAKLAVSALIFDYILTGPISGVAAGQYIAGLINHTLEHFGVAFQLPVNATACAICIFEARVVGCEHRRAGCRRDDRARLERPRRQRRASL
jgi:hypothetical protein